ncbi:MAG: DEAD/DEAH box helicase, partial [Nanopusillaceae archaeon]
MTILVVNKKPKENEVFLILEDCVREWFKKTFKKFTLPQLFGIKLIHEGKNTLITAPTGSGKTLACFLSIINELVKLSKENKLEDYVYCIYVSPLRALANDIR